MNPTDLGDDTLSSHYRKNLYSMFEKETPERACTIMREDPKIAAAVLDLWDANIKLSTTSKPSRQSNMDNETQSSTVE